MSWAAGCVTLYAGQARHPERITAIVDDAYVDELARALTGELGGRVGVAPRLFLRKLVRTCSTGSTSSPTSTPDAHYRAHPGPHRAHRRRAQRRDARAGRTTSSSTCDSTRCTPRSPTTSSTRLGWRDLRPLQGEAIEPLLAGRDALLLAPTAGGKTEAAIFPLLTAMERDRGPGCRCSTSAR